MEVDTPTFKLHMPEYRRVYPRSQALESCCSSLYSAELKQAVSCACSNPFLDTSAELSKFVQSLVIKTALMVNIIIQAVLIIQRESLLSLAECCFHAVNPPASTS